MQLLKSFFLFFASFYCFFAEAQAVLTLQPDESCGKDAILHGLSWEREVNFGSNPQFCANSWTFDGEPGNVRSIVEFDLSQLPADAVVTSAYLSLYAWPYTSGFGQHSSYTQSDIGWLRRVTSEWNESTVTWNTQPTFTTANQIVVPESTSADEDYLNMDVTQLVVDMRNDPDHSFGFLLMEQIDDYYCRLNFCSSDIADPAKRPKLVINYTSNNPFVSPLYIGPDFSMCPGESQVVHATPNTGTFVWQDGSTGSSYTITEPGTYWVMQTTCTGTFADTLIVTAGDCDPNSNPGDTIPGDTTSGDTTVISVIPVAVLKLPNAFTPNGDGSNDLFVPVEMNGISEMHFCVLNRWGSIVFQSVEPNISWDGRSNGNPVPDGVYFWIAECTDHFGNRVNLQGNVSVFR